MLAPLLSIVIFFGARSGRSHGAGTASSLRAIGISQGHRQIGAKHLEINSRLEDFELIPEVAQPLQEIVNVEKTGLA